MNRHRLNSPTEPTALLADDDAAIRFTLAALPSQKAYVVMAVDNGVTAVETLSRNAFTSNQESSPNVLSESIGMGRGLASDDSGKGYSLLSCPGTRSAKIPKIDQSSLQSLDSNKQVTALLAQSQCDEIQGMPVSISLPAAECVLWRGDREAQGINPSTRFETVESITQWR